MKFDHEAANCHDIIPAQSEKAIVTCKNYSNDESRQVFFVVDKLGASKAYKIDDGIIKSEILAIRSINYLAGGNQFIM